jgi:hypothetical protein
MRELYGLFVKMDQEQNADLPPEPKEPAAARQGSDISHLNETAYLPSTTPQSMLSKPHLPPISPSKQPHHA